LLHRVPPVLVLALALSACASVVQTDVGVPVVVERLFFGRNVDGVEAVSESDWKAFLDQVVTPRFPKGFSVWEARGQFRRADGAVEDEASFVLEFIHPAGTTADADIDAITAEYKRRFRQESVLHLVIPGRAEF
jgi:hypothetical protein